MFLFVCTVFSSAFCQFDQGVIFAFPHSDGIMFLYFVLLISVSKRVIIIIGRNYIATDSIHEEEYYLAEFIDMALPEEQLRVPVPDEMEDYLSMFIDHASAGSSSEDKDPSYNDPSGVEIMQSIYLSGYSSFDYSSVIDTVRISTARISPAGMRFYIPDTTLICYTLSGEGEIFVGGKVIKCRKYDCVCINCDKRPHFRAYPGEPWDCAIIRVSGKFKSDLYPALCGHIQEQGTAFMTFGAGTRFRSVIWELLSIKTENSIYFETLYSHLLLSLFLELDMAITLSADKPTIIPDIILDIQRYLDNNYSKDINLDLLAKTFNISKFHMSREFKKNIGKSPIDYLIDVRIARAKSLLYDSDRSIASICQLVGIPNPNHFLYLFKEREGITPSAFRRFKL